MVLAGTRPGGRPPFLLRGKKGGKETRPTSATLRGNLRRGACGVCRRTHCAPLALRSDNCGKSDDDAWALRRPWSPRNRPAAGAASRGGGAFRAIAALGPVRWRSAPRKPGRAQRWPGCFPWFPSGRAEERRAGRNRARDCLSAAGASSSETPPRPSTAGCGLLGSDTHFTAVRSTAPLRGEPKAR